MSEERAASSQCPECLPEELAWDAAMEGLGVFLDDNDPRLVEERGHVHD